MEDRTHSRGDLAVDASSTCNAEIAASRDHGDSAGQGALASDLTVAGKVQRRFLPLAAPDTENYEFFGYYQAAHQVGGDFFDYVPLSGGRWAVLVADVAGKGIAASLLMARMSAESRWCLTSHDNPCAAMGHLNRWLCRVAHDGHFATMAVVVLDPAQHRLTVVNAGHCPPLLRRQSGVVETMRCHENMCAGLPLGIQEEGRYDPCSVELRPGDTFVLYTDGVTEAMGRSGELFGLGRLRGTLSRASGRPQALGQRVLRAVREFLGPRPQTDDLCFTCFRRADGQSPTITGQEVSR